MKAISTKFFIKQSLPLSTTNIMSYYAITVVCMASEYVTHFILYLNYDGKKNARKATFK